MNDEQCIEIVKSVANRLFWEDGALWTGKDDVPWGDPHWMTWRSSNTVSTFINRALETLPSFVRQQYEAALVD